MESVTGMIFDIQHFSLHDGPGVRSTVFFKGCPLACKWCGNPESQRSAPQLLYFQNLCTGCGACVDVCPRQALSLDANGLIMKRDACTACGACVDVCPQSARQISGRPASVEEVCAELRQHWRIFQTSGGGVTCSGGEALAQPDFLHALLRELHDGAGLHTCLETSGGAPWTVLERMLPFLDMIFLDVKHMDGAMHKRGAGVDNGMILDNARKLAESRHEVVIRVPLLPGFNDDDGNLRALARFMRDSGLGAVELMPYHTLGLAKYHALGRRYAFTPVSEPNTDRAVDILTDAGIAVEVHAH